MLAVGIPGMDNDALNSINQFQRAALATLDGFCGFAPAASQEGGGGGAPRRGGGILVAHDADQDLDRGPGMASRKGADVDGSSWHVSHASRFGADRLARPDHACLRQTKNPRPVSRRGHLVFAMMTMCR
jgi:hypothetical protein